MDTVTLVENKKIEDGQQLVEQFVADGSSVTLAFWVKTAENGFWFLYIATTTVGRFGPSAANYLSVFESLAKIADSWIRNIEITLIEPNDPIVRSVMALLARYPGTLPAHFGQETLAGREMFGNLEVAELYVYPDPRKTVDVTIYGLFFKDEPSGALHLSFEPHDPDTSLTIESIGKCKKEYHAETISWRVAAPEGSALERDDKGNLELAWNFRGHRTRSNANEIEALAKLGLHGFFHLRCKAA